MSCSHFIIRNHKVDFFKQVWTIYFIMKKMMKEKDSPKNYKFFIYQSVYLVDERLENKCPSLLFSILNDKRGYECSKKNY